MNYNYQDAKMESQQEYFGTIHTDNTKTLQNTLDRIAELEQQIEKMRCCQNCVHFDFNEPKYCFKGVYNCAYVCNKWALGN